MPEMHRLVMMTTDSIVVLRILPEERNKVPKGIAVLKTLGLTLGALLLLQRKAHEKQAEGTGRPGSGVHASIERYQRIKGGGT